MDDTLFLFDMLCFMPMLVNSRLALNISPGE